MAIFAFVFYILGCRTIDAIRCGTTDFNQRLIVGGTSTERGEFPFLAALFWMNELKFICGGSLISPKHVLTAAHCVKGPGFVFVPDDIVVLLGAYDLTARLERGVIQRDIIEIHIHPDWYEHNVKQDADIAILVLSKTVIFTNHIRPVCMPPDNSVVASANGTIVGWGLTENGTESHLKYPKRGFTIALNDSYCYTTDSDAARISSLRTFCGMGGNSSPNRGDSGGGFFVRYGSAWVQYGIVSTLRTNTTGYVGTNSIAIYTNVNVFKTWISDTVRRSQGRVDEANVTVKIQIQLECNYGFWPANPNYICFLNNLDIRSDNVEVTSFTGSHRTGKTKEDVTELAFQDGKAPHIPDGIANIFINLKIVEIRNMKTKLIRSNFKNLNNLVELIIFESDFETFEEDCLWDLRELKVFDSLQSNARKLEENTFVNNHKLKKIILCYNRLNFIPAKLFENNLLLEEVDLSYNHLKIIDERTFVNNRKLKEIDLRINDLNFIPRDLFKNNFLLKKINISYNSLKIIEIDVATFKNIRTIDFSGNKCTSSVYDLDFEAYSEEVDETKTLIELQNDIRANCRSRKP